MGVTWKQKRDWTWASLGAPHSPAVGGHICEDSEQEVACMAWLEGSGDDNIAALGLVRSQEDTAGIDVDGAGHPRLKAVHAVLAVLFHLRERPQGATSALVLPWSQEPASKK